MKEFMYFFRMPKMDYSTVSPKEMEAVAKKWQEWVQGIVAQGKLSSNGQRLSLDGRVLKPGGVVTDGPFVEVRELLGGYIVIKAESLDDATTLAHGCPALDAGGSVEIRPLYS